MSEKLTPSQALATVLQKLIDFKDLGENEVLEINHHAASNIYRSLTEIRRACWKMEHELQMHRLGDATVEGQKLIQQLAMDQFVELVVDPEGKVVRPDFRKGGRS